MNAETIKEWLKNEGRDRTWLAEQIGYTKGSVNNWLSAGRAIPEPAKKLIDLLMQGRSSNLNDPFHVTFTAGEFEEIEQARQLVGAPTRPEFYHDAVMEKAEAIIAWEKAQGLYPLEDVQAAKAAEEPLIGKKPLVLDAGAPAKSTDLSSGTVSTETTQN